MAAALVKSAQGSASTATVNPSFGSATTAGNLIVLAFAGDDYNGSPGAGWTQSAEMEQQTFHGGYLWWRISTGETSFSYTIGSASFSSWAMAEFSGLNATPYDISEGVYLQASQDTYTSAPITPTSGDRLIVAAFGSSLSSGAAVPGSWTNSFTGITGAAGGVTAIGIGYLLVTANGSTAYSTGVSYAPTTPQTHSAMMISFLVAGGGTAPVNTASPVLTGATPVGSVLSTTTGTWTGSPTPTYTYQWYRKLGGGAENTIPGATSSTYTTVSGDAGYNVRCRVTATNASGSPSAYNATSVLVDSSVAKTGTETFTVTDASVGAQTKAVTDDITLSDNDSSVDGGVFEGGTLSEAASVSQTGPSTVTVFETFVLTEARADDVAQLLADTSNLNEAAAVAVNHVVSDSISGGDGGVVFSGGSPSVIDTHSFAEALAVAVGHGRVDAVALAEVSQRTSLDLFAVIDSMSFGDSAVLTVPSSQNLVVSDTFYFADIGPDPGQPVTGFLRKDDGTLVTSTGPGVYTVNELERSADGALCITPNGVGSWSGGWVKDSNGYLCTAPGAAGKWQNGFLRDTQGRLCTSYSGPFYMVNGFMRDSAGRLGIV